LLNSDWANHALNNWTQIISTKALPNYCMVVLVYFQQYIVLVLIIPLLKEIIYG